MIEIAKEFLGQTLISKDDDDDIDFRMTSSESDNGLQDTLVAAQGDAVAEQGDAIENVVVVEEEEEQAPTELTRSQKFKSLTEVLDENNYDSI